TEYAGRCANQRCCQSFHATPATRCEHEFHKTNSSAVSRRRRARSEQQVQRNGRWPDERQTDRERPPRGGEVSGGPTEGAQTRSWRRRQRSARWLPGHPREFSSRDRAAAPFPYKRLTTCAEGQTRPGPRSQGGMIGARLIVMGNLRLCRRTREVRQFREGSESLGRTASRFPSA